MLALGIKGRIYRLIFNTLSINIHYTYQIVRFRMFKAGMKLDAFYNLLVKEGELPEKDVEVVAAAKDAEKFAVDIEDSRSTIEVSHSFSSSDNYFLSYIVRTVRSEENLALYIYVDI